MYTNYLSYHRFVVEIGFSNLSNNFLSCFFFFTFSKTHVCLLQVKGHNACFQSLYMASKVTEARATNGSHNLSRTQRSNSKN